MFKDKMSDGTVRLTGGKSAGGGGGGGGGWTPKNFDEVLSSITGKAHHWKFNETSGSMVADSVGSLPLTMSGTYTRNSDLSPSGRPSTYFSGTGSQAVSSGIGNIPIGNDDRTILVLFKKADENSATIFGYGSEYLRKAFGTTVHTLVDLNILSFFTWGGNGADLVPKAASSFNEWTLLSFSYRNRTLEGFVNGDSNSDYTNDVLNTPSSNFYVGCWITGVRRFKGHISDVVVFDRAIGKIELDELYDSLKHGYDAGGGGGGGIVNWSDVQNKPADFTPSAHTHEKSDITGLETDITNIQTALGGVKFVLTEDYSSIVSPDPWTVYIEVAELPEV